MKNSFKTALQRWRDVPKVQRFRYSTIFIAQKVSQHKSRHFCRKVFDYCKRHCVFRIDFANFKSRMTVVLNSIHRPVLTGFFIFTQREKLNESHFIYSERATCSTL
jgi:hypothetical protein